MISQHCFRYHAVRCQAITWTNVDLSMMPYGITRPQWVPENFMRCRRRTLNSVGNYIFEALARKQMSLIYSIQKSTRPGQFSTRPAQNALALVSGPASFSFPHCWMIQRINEFGSDYLLPWISILSTLLILIAFVGAGVLPLGQVLLKHDYPLWCTDCMGLICMHSKPYF